MNGFKKYTTSGLLVFVLCMCLCSMSVFATETDTTGIEITEEVLEEPDVSGEEINPEDIPPDQVEIVEDIGEADVQDTATGDGDSTEQSGGEDNAEILAVLNEINLKLTSVEEVPVEIVKEDYQIFAPQQVITQGEATITDVYNALVALHNLGLLFVIVYLIIWSSEKIVSAFRRFIY